MNPPRWYQALQDIQTHCQFIVEDVTGLNQQEFSDNRLIRQAVERNLEIIGIASAIIRDENPDLFDEMEDLRHAIGLRNRLAHGYDERIDQIIIWETVQNSVPNLLRDINVILENDGHFGTFERS